MPKVAVAERFKSLMCLFRSWLRLYHLPVPAIGFERCEVANEVSVAMWLLCDEQQKISWVMLPHQYDLANCAPRTTDSRDNGIPAVLVVTGDLERLKVGEGESSPECTGANISAQ